MREARDAKRTTTALVLLLAVAVSACASPERRGELEAPKDADTRADQLERDLGRGVRTFGGDARTVAGAEVVGQDHLRLLGASGSVNGEEAPLVEVEITGHAVATDGGIGGRSWPETTVHRCCTFELRNDDAVRGRGTDCDDEPTSPATPLPTSPPTVQLGDDVLTAVQDVLTRSGSAADVRAALAPTVPAEALVDVQTVDGTLGVGIWAPPPTRDCVLGRRLPDGTVETWVPPGITVAPGEASCDGTTAAAGGAKLSPH